MCGGGIEMLSTGIIRYSVSPIGLTFINYNIRMALGHSYFVKYDS